METLCAPLDRLMCEDIHEQESRGMEEMLTKRLRAMEKIMPLLNQKNKKQE